MVDGVTVDDYHYLTIKHATLNGVDFSGRTEKDWIVVESRLEGCRFENLRVKDFHFGAGAVTSEYVECVFDNSHIRALITGNARFIRCTFRNARLTKWICDQVEFIDCVFTGSVLRQINFNANVPGNLGAAIGRTRNRYEGNDFSGAELNGVAFLGGIDLRKQRLPKGEDYIFIDNAEEVLSEALRSVAGWPGSVEKSIILNGLDFYRDRARRGQQQLLLSRHFFAKKGDDGKRTFTLLRDVFDAALDATRQMGSVELEELLESPLRNSFPCAYFRAADPDAALAARNWERGPLEGGEDRPGFDGVTADGVEPFLVLGSLLALIHETRWSPDVVPFATLWPPFADEPAFCAEAEQLAQWNFPVGIQELDASVRDTLADVDDDKIPQLASAWAQLEEIPSRPNCSLPEINNLVNDIVSLARRTRDAGDRLYCWTRSPV